MELKFFTFVMFVTFLQPHTALSWIGPFPNGDQKLKKKDKEPPRFTICPDDVTVVTTEFTRRVNWPRPEAVDNSGIPPIIHSSRQSGSHFGVGEFTITITAQDQQGNRAKPCKFKVIVKKKPCILPPPPKNGAVVCSNLDGDLLCAITCQKPFDFARNPARFYLCGYGKWFNQLSSYTRQEVYLPWPNCAMRDEPSFLQKERPNLYQYSGSASVPVVRSKIKDEFLKFIKDTVPPGFYCKGKCTADKIKVFY